MSESDTKTLTKQLKELNVNSSQIESLMDLDDDCLMYLLRFFDILGLMKIRKLCRRLNNLVLQFRTRFANINFEEISDFYEEDSYDILKFMGPDIKSLELDTKYFKRTEVDTEIFDWINENCMALEAFTHKIANLDNLTTFQQLTPLIKRLKSLTLKGSYFDDKLCDSLADTKLEELKIFDNPKITKNFFNHVLNFKSLSFVNCAKMTTDSLIEILKKNLKLKKLEVVHPATLEDSQTLVDFITTQLPEIEEFSFNVLASNVNLFGDLPNLKKLSISQISDENLNQTTISQELNKLLEKLIENNIIEELSIENKELQKNMNLICKLTTLKTLTLKGNKFLVDDDFRKLQNLKNLEALTFGQEFITSAVFTMIESMPKLKRLEMKKVDNLTYFFFKKLIEVIKAANKSHRFKIVTGKVDAGGIEVEMVILMDDNKKIIDFSEVELMLNTLDNPCSCANCNEYASECSSDESSDS